MTAEELLIPRYKVIAIYPQSNINPFKVDDILVKNGIHFTRIGNPKSIHQDEVDKYPHLFRKLEWHEGRKPEDMPQYVLNGEHAFKVTRWFYYYGLITPEVRISRMKTTLNTLWLKPIAEKEYKAYKKQKPQL